MPRNASGIYTLPGGNPVTPGDVIEADWANTTLEDVADALTNSLSRTGAGGMLAPFRIADGSVSGPGLSYLNETNTGLYRSGSGSTWMAVLGVNVAQFSTVGLTVAAGKALTVLGNASASGTLSVTGATTLASTLAVTGAITATGGVVGNVTGNVTAGSGTSTFNDVVITGALDMTAGSSATITGLSTPTNASDAANKGYVDTQDALRLALTGGTMSGAIAMGSSKITGLATPTADQDAATKAYVDSVAQGLDVKASCRAATTANITLSGAQTIDGVAVIAGDRVLVKNQSSAAENGIYVAAAGSWSRSTDADTWAELVGAFTFVEDGTVNDNSGWVCTSAPGGTLGVTAVVFEQFSGAGQITAGAGLTKSGNTLNVGTASSSRIVVGTDDIDLATTGVTASTYKSVTVDAYGRVTAGTNPTTLAGFGITDAYTQAQVDAALALKLNLTGGTMSGVIAMGANKITGLADPTLAQDAATKNYIDTIFGSTTTAAASAAAAAASASAASASASSASGSATAAAGSATSAAASYTAFDNQYLGSKSSNPTVNNTGGALVEGNLYWNSSSNQMRVYDGSAWVAAYIPAEGYAQLAATNTFTANQIISVNTSSAALSITQAGSGNALYIEDVAADATPFVVSSTGAVGIGTTTPDNVTSAGIALVSNDGYYPQVVNRNKSNDTTASYLVFDKDRAGSIVQNGDALGAIVWRSFDGANYLQSSAIIGYSAGTPGTNDVPGSLSFFTTADGAASPSERLKIASTGAFGLGGSNYGTSGQVLTSAGSGAAPTWESAPAPVPTFTASGAISAAGITVALNSDGTVSAISGSTTSFSAGTTQTLPSNRTGSSASAAYDPVNQKIVVLAQYSSFLMGYVGTISGTTITFGSEYQIVTSAVSYNKIAYDTANNKFVALYAISNTQRVKVLTVSGTTISAGAETTLTNSAGYISGIDLVYNPIAGQFVSAGYDGNNDTALWLFTVSGTSVTVNFYPTSAMLLEFFSNSLSCNPVTGTIALGGKSAVTGATYPYVYPVTVSATKVSVGSGTQLSSSNAGDFTTPVFFGSTTAGYGLAIVFTTSNTDNAILLATGEEVNGGFSLGGTYAYGSGYSVAGSFGVAANPAGSNIVITWPDGNDGYAKSLTAYVNKNGTATFGSVNNLFTPANGVPSALVYCTNISKMVFIGNNSSNSRYTTIVFTPDGYASNAQSFIGFSTASASSGASVGVSMFANMNTNQSGLTLGSRYNITYTGTLTTSTTGFPYAGKAYGTTKILVGV